MSSLPINEIDCRGQQCPQPILSTAKAARSMKGSGGLLRVVADDDAFPADIESWCRSANAELVSLETADGTYHATVKLAGPKTTTMGMPPMHTTAGPTLVVSSPSVPSEAEILGLDCCGMQCPGPIVEVAKFVRSMEPGTTFVVTADDDAFDMDIASWARSNGSKLVEITNQGGISSAKIVYKGVERTEPPAAPMRGNHQAPGSPSTGLLTIDLTATPPAQRLNTLWGQAVNAPAGTSTLEVHAPDMAFGADIASWCKLSGHRLAGLTSTTNGVIATVALTPVTPDAAPVASAAASSGVLVTMPPAVPATSSNSDIAPLAVPAQKSCAILVLHNDFEAIMAALLIANTAVAQGMNTSIFFTFWGLNALRGERPRKDVEAPKTSWMQRMMKWMMPKGPKRQKLGQMNFGGAGKMMMNSIMKDKNIMTMPELFDAAVDAEVRFIACTMSMSVMGITKADLMDLPNLEYGGASVFVENAANADINMIF